MRPKGKPTYPRFVYNGDGEKVPYDIYDEYKRTKKVGDTVCSFAGAPGTGKIIREIIWIDDEGIWCKEIFNNVRIMDIADVY